MIDRILRGLAGAVVVCLGTGCSGAGFVLKSPAVSRCEDAGLHKCDDLVDGVLAYADGKPDEGQVPLKRGLAENMEDPESIEKFVNALKLMKNLPSVGAYIKAIDPALNVMLEAAKEAKKNPRPKRDKTGPGATGAALAKGGETKGSTAVGGVKTRTVLVASSAKAKPCGAFMGMSLANAPAGSAKCVQILSGAYTISDVHVASGCTNTVFLAVGDIESPRWFVAASPGQPLDLHGSQLVVDADESVYVGQMGNAISADLACAITWTGG